jgi:hypothetical protein
MAELSRDLLSVNEISVDIEIIELFEKTWANSFTGLSKNQG